MISEIVRPKYKQESGAILDYSKTPLCLVDGDAGSVDFPPEVIWLLSGNIPIYALSHIHPPGMKALSKRDENLLKAWSFALYPMPVRVITITEDNSTFSFFNLVETCYLGCLEPKESWEKRKEETKEPVTRKFEIINEWSHRWSFLDEVDQNWYGSLLIKRSYGEG